MNQDTACLLEMVVPGGEARGCFLGEAQFLEVSNTYGSQVVDLWAFLPSDPLEHLSMPHSRLHMGRVSPKVGDTLTTNRHRPALTLMQDSSPGVHDTLMPACDQRRYELLGAQGPHRNCVSNLRQALQMASIEFGSTPDPLNLFENVVAARGGRLAIAAPVSKPGDFVILRAEVDLYVVCSACPQDILPTNGVCRHVRPVRLRVAAEP